MTAIEKKYKNAIKIEASTTRSTNTTNFVVKGANEATVKAARKELSVSLAKRVTLEIPIPQSLRAFVIGAKGKNLKNITDQTNCRVNIPRQEESAEGNTKPSGGARDEIDYEDDEQISVVIEGDEINARQAAKMIQDLVAERTSKVTQRLTTIEHIFYPFVAGPKGANATRLETEVGNGDVSVRVPPRAAFLPPKEAEDEEKEPRRERDLSIVVTGDREQVQKVVQTIEAQVDEMRRNFRKLDIQVPKRQHRFLVGDAANDILAATQCSVELAPQDDPSDNVTIRGPHTQLTLALGAVMDKANAVKVEVVDVVAAHRSAANPLQHAKNLLRWLAASGKLPRSEGVQIYPPRAALIESTGNVQIEIVGADEAGVAQARSNIDSIVKGTPPSFTDSVEFDPLLQGMLIGKKGSNLKEYEKRGVEVLFPSASAAGGESSAEILLFVSPSASLPSEKKAREAEAKKLLEGVKADIVKASQTAADFRTEVLKVPAKFHRAIVGTGGSTLNAVLGEERLADVRVGNTGDQTGKEDTITIRGPSSEVERVATELRRIAKEAEDDAIVNGHEVSFAVDPAHVKHLVGKSGAAITKLREELGVRVDFDDAASAGATNGAAKAAKKASVTCKIVGRKENVEEAKKRILAQAEKLADEREEVLKIPQNLHAAVIGKGGVWVLRLQENHGVRIDFPRQGGDSANGEGNKREQKSDEVIVRGGKQGVAAAKAEIMELLEYEKENNNVVEVSVAAQSIARIMGKGGATINQIRDDSGAQIDVDAENGKDATRIKLRGTKSAIAEAKAAIMAIDAEVKGEETFTLHIPSKYHGQLIGPGGQGIRDLITRATGSDEAASSRSATQLVQFPRRGEQNADVVIVRGPSAIATKIKADLEAAAKVFTDRICHGVVATPDQQRLLIGRGGSRRSELEAKYNVRLVFPGRPEHGQEDVLNVAEVGEAPKEHIVKILGKESDVESIKKEIASSAATTSVVKVPRSLAPKLGQPNFFRDVRSRFGVSIDTPRASGSSSLSKPSGSVVTQSSAAEARIDADETDDDANGGLSFELIQLDQSTESGQTVDWTLSAKGEAEKASASLAKAEAYIKKSISEAANVTHEGRLIVPESAVPRIVGKRGAGLQSIEADSPGVSVEIPREGGGLCIIRGSESAVLETRDRLVRIATQPPRRGGNDY